MRSQFLFESFLPTFCFGQPVEIRRVLNFLTFSSNIAFEEFVLRSLRASPLTKPFFINARWVTAVFKVCALKCFSTRLRTSRILSFSNRSSFVEGVKGVIA